MCVTTQAAEFVFTETGRGGQHDPLDDMLPYGMQRKKGLRPIQPPTAKPRLYLGNAPPHSILPPPLPGTMTGRMAPLVQQHVQALASPADLAVSQPSPGEDLVEAAGDDAAGYAITFEVPDACGADASEDEWEDVEEVAVPPEIAQAPPATAPSPPHRAAATAPSAADIISLLSDEDDHPPGGPGAPASADAAPGKLSRRQLYARSHGFLMGRSLDDWADEGEVVPLLNAGQQRPATIAAAEEDMDIAVANARSLQDTEPQVPPDAPAAAARPHGSDDDLVAALALSLQPDVGAGASRPGVNTGAGDDEVAIVGVRDAPGGGECPAFLLTTHDGATVPLSWPAFSAVVDNIRSTWPPWLPEPLELEEEPVRVSHVGSGAEWVITNPVLSSLTLIRREARQVEAGGGAQRQAAPPSSNAMAAPPARHAPATAPKHKQAKPRVAFSAPDDMLVNGPATAWDEAWEGAAAEYQPPPQAGGGFTAPDAAAAAQAARLDDEFEAERAVLRAEQRAASKAADAVTPEMYVEVQELLTMFGIPYIIAPFEAEAQCAWLEEAGLVDAVVTDDSDVLLFGAKTVCRNIFEARKFVELYTADAISERLGLNREHLTLMALLLGSDYTPGVTGVGIVHAAEILSAFPGMDGLRRFKAWVDAPESDLVAEELRGGKKGGRKHKGKAPASDDEAPEVIVINDDDAPATEVDTPAAADFKRRHAGARKTFVLGDSFPNQAVVDAYLKPQVDTSRERFEWGAPDELLLRHFCAQRLGWPHDKVDPILQDILRQHAVRETQRTVTSFFRPQDGEAFAKVRSKRLVKAIAQLTGREDPSLALGDQDDAIPKPPRQKKPKAPRKRALLQEGAEGGAGGAGGAGPSKRRHILQPGQRLAEDGVTIVEPSGLGFDVAVLGSEF
jgi:5'-3' exonuclease